MEYDDYPQTLDDNVVNSLKQEYSNSDVSTMGVSELLQGLNDNIREIKLNELLGKIAQALDRVLNWLNIIRRLDRKSGKALDEHIDSTLQQKEIVVGFVTNPQILHYDSPSKSPNFHKCCVEYSKCEFDLIDNLLELCAMEDVCINTKCFYDFVCLRMHIFRELFTRYTI